MTMAIAHDDPSTGRCVVDAVREVRPKFSPADVVEQFVQTLRNYRIPRITGDRYGAAWVAERFSECGVVYDPADKPAAQLDLELLPALNSRLIELPDDRRLISQLCSLERRTSRAGRDAVVHPVGAHDDLANAVAGVWAEKAPAGVFIADEMLESLRRWAPSRRYVRGS